MAVPVPDRVQDGPAQQRVPAHDRTGSQAADGEHDGTDHAWPQDSPRNSPEHSSNSGHNNYAPFVPGGER
ncbi:hypothetical protein GCM10022267_07870 [Lentzea roselyniae]|uniref:Uncharacterized protein n=1 Tax=Lentzea roselyniae TaxID=531940 RepID=A0ABP7A3I2_9PSEU